MSWARASLLSASKTALGMADGSSRWHVKSTRKFIINMISGPMFVSFRFPDAAPFSGGRLFSCSPDEQCCTTFIDINGFRLFPRTECEQLNSSARFQHIPKTTLWLLLQLFINRTREKFAIDAPLKRSFLVCVFRCSEEQGSRGKKSARRCERSSMAFGFLTLWWCQ